MRQDGNSSMWEQGFGGEWNVPQSVGDISFASDDDFTIFHDVGMVF